MEKIKFEYLHNKSVSKIVLSNGKGNILDSGMMKELHELFLDFKTNNDLKLIIFEGEGNHFCFGASVEEHTKENAPIMLSNFNKLFYELIDLSIPTLAKVSGQCLGGGMELAIMCNVILCDKTAKFGQPEIVLGVFAPVASLILPYKIGSGYADELLISGRTISAEEAKAIGLVNEICDDKAAMETSCQEWIEKNILPKSASSLRFAVKASRIKLNRIIKKDLPKLENKYIKQLMETNDANEGINSFLEKRKPIWQNK
ncbi:MAG: enoyl-CoA hydratase-related protein [FCB group bacterium]|jgi:cyclohexa-1,5-dienecarbonyl-CoA hydratase